MNIQSIEKILSRLMAIDTDMSVGRAAVLIDVATRSHTTPSEVADRLSMTLATASRHLAYWSDRDRHRKDGKGLIEYFEDKFDRRVRYVRLTPQGKLVIKTISEGEE